MAPLPPFRRALGFALPFELGADVYTWLTTNPRWHASCEALVRHFPGPSPGRPLRVVDLGCGPARTTRTLKRALPGAVVIGVDLSRRMVRLASRGNREGVELLRADAGRLPLADGSVDVVTGHSFLYLVPDRPQVLREAFRVLRPGGRYVSMEPGSEPKDGAFLRAASGDVRFLISVALWRPYSRAHGQLGAAEFRALLEEAGFVATAASSALGGWGTVGRGDKPAV